METPSLPPMDLRLRDWQLGLRFSRRMLRSIRSTTSCWAGPDVGWRQRLGGVWDCGAKEGWLLYGFFRVGGEHVKMMGILANECWTGLRKRITLRWHYLCRNRVIVYRSFFLYIFTFRCKWHGNHPMALYMPIIWKIAIPTLCRVLISQC